MTNPFLVYSKKERWGILTLVMLNVVLFFISFTFTPPPPKYTDKDLLTFQESVRELYKEKPMKKESVVDSMYAFDPNVAEYEELVSLGFSRRVAKNIISYRSKGGHFYSAKSVQKIYGMDSVFFEKIAPFIEMPEFEKKKLQKNNRPFAHTPTLPKQSFPFDPNTVSKTKLQALGFSQRVIKNIMNYRQKGGRFYTPEAIRKIYGMTDDFYQSILPNIRIDKSQIADKQPFSAKGVPVSKPRVYGRKVTKIWPKGRVVKINIATTEEWEQLPGIGPFFAKSIVRYRSQLGGFYAIEQVAEAYRLTDSTFQKIAPFLVVDRSELKKINPQLASFKEINSHPYISFEQTKAIMRAQRGIRLMAPEDFLIVKIFSQKQLDRVLPYFQFGE